MDIQHFREKIFPYLPDSAGVYQFVGEADKVLYVGKAKNLKNRVASYFNNLHQHTGKTKLLVKKAINIEFTVVETEHDALLLENAFIKKYQPKYNVDLKDDKSYPFIVIKNERFPRLFLTRRKVNDGSEYLGPFTSVAKVRDVLEFLRRVYPIRSCNYNLSDENISKGKFKVCLEYHIGNCLGPCEARQSEEDYNHNIQQIRQILKGETAGVMRHVKQEMMDRAEAFEFEAAEKLKERLQFLKQFQSKSAVVSPHIDNVDVFHIEMVGDKGFVSYFKLINGSIIQTSALQVKRKLDESASDLLSYAILNIRDQYQSAAHEIIVPFRPEYSFDDIVITVPQRGEKKKLLNLAYKNALEFKNRVLTKLDKHKSQSRNTIRILEQLKSDFHMQELPQHIECFDNSNIQGTTPVASAVVFKDGKPVKKDYRHYNIKSVIGPDDYASMEEVVYRRYRRMTGEDTPLPQLILIDGGKGQLSAAVKSLERLGIRQKLTIAAIAKRLEEIYFPGDPIPLHINKQSPSLKLLQQIRNEAHRFAITFHRSKRNKSALRTELTDINGIGEKTATTLLREFKSIKKIEELSKDALARVVGNNKAELIHNYYHPDSKKPGFGSKPGS